MAAFFLNIVFFPLGYSHRPFRWQSDPAVTVPGEGSNAVNSVYESPRTPISFCPMTDGFHLGCIYFNEKVDITYVKLRFIIILKSSKMLFPIANILAMFEIHPLFPNKMLQWRLQSFRDVLSFNSFHGYQKRILKSTLHPFLGWAFCSFWLGFFW